MQPPPQPAHPRSSMPWHDPSPHGELEGMGNSGKEAMEYFSFTKKAPLY